VTLSQELQRGFSETRKEGDVSRNLGQKSFALRIVKAIKL